MLEDGRQEYENKLIISLRDRTVEIFSRVGSNEKESLQYLNIFLCEELNIKACLHRNITTVQSPTKIDYEGPTLTKENLEFFTKISTEV